MSNAYHMVYKALHTTMAPGRPSNPSRYYTCVYAVPLKVTWNCFLILENVCPFFKLKCHILYECFPNFFRQY